MRKFLGSLPRSQVGGFGLQLLFAIVVPLLTLPLALQSVSFAAVVALALLTLIAGACFGIETTGGVILLAAFAAAPWDNVRPVPALHFIALSDVLFAVGFLILVPHLLGRSLQVPALYAAGAIGMLSIGIVSSIGDADTAASFNHLLRFAVGAFGLATLLAWWNSNRRWTIAAASAYVIGNCVNVVGSYFKGSVDSGRYFGYTTHPNVMGLCAALGFALTPFLFSSVARPYRWLIAIGSAMCFWGIWISGSRAALVAVLAMGVLYPFLTRSIPAGIAVTAFGFASVYLLDWAATHLDSSNALARALGGGSAADSDEQREALARIAIDQFLAHPVLGSGLGTVMEAHSIYLQLLAAIGLFGAACFMVALAALIAGLFRLPKPYDFLAAPALTYAMAGLVSPLLWDRYIWCVVAFALIAPRLAAEDRSADSDTESAAPPDGISMAAERRGVASGS